MELKQFYQKPELTEISCIPEGVVCTVSGNINTDGENYESFNDQFEDFWG